MKLSKTTREQLLNVARRQFAVRGFYGTSIASIADELGLSKQALLHHFGSKEKLYGEILKDISERSLSKIIQTQADTSDPLLQLEALMIGRWERQFEHKDDAQLLTRELLDNQCRAEHVSNWYLKPFLDALVSIVQKIPSEEELSDTQALAFVCQLLGAVNYIVMSEPTLTQMFGSKAIDKVKAQYPEQLRLLIRARFPED